MLSPDNTIPAATINRFHDLVKGHEQLLRAIGRL